MAVTFQQNRWATAVFALSFCSFPCAQELATEAHWFLSKPNTLRHGKEEKYPPESSIDFVQHVRSISMYLLPFGHSVSYANSAVKQLPLILSRWSAPNSPIQTARLAILHYCDTALRSDYCTTHRQQSLKAVEPAELIQNGKYWKMSGVLGIKAFMKRFCEQLVTPPFSD